MEEEEEEVVVVDVGQLFNAPWSKGNLESVAGPDKGGGGGGGGNIDDGVCAAPGDSWAGAATEVGTACPKLPAVEIPDIEERLC